MENEYDYPPNVHFIDEYPELKKRVWLRNLARQRMGVVALPRVLQFPIMEEHFTSSNEEQPDRATPSYPTME